MKASRDFGEFVIKTFKNPNYDQRYGIMLYKTVGIKENGGFLWFFLNFFPA